MSQKISPYDGLPQAYCKKCLNAINACCAFRRLCVISAQQLQAILKERIRHKEQVTKIYEPSVPQPQPQQPSKEDRQTIMELEIEQLDDGAAVNADEYSVDYIDTKYETLDEYNDYEYVQQTQHSGESSGTIQYGGGIIITSHEDAEHLKAFANTADDDDLDGRESTDYYADNLNNEPELTVKVEPADDPEPVIERQSVEYVDEQSTEDDEPVKKRTRRRKSGKRKTGEKELCPDCGGLFISLKNHMQTHRDKNKRKCYNCDKCGAKFVNKASYVGHVNKHNNLTPFKCPKCPRSFHGSGNLRMHMNSHATVSKFICNECGKAFRYSHMLALHRRSHTLERVYSCEICPYSSVNRENYKNHMMNHTGQYRFNCDKCMKGFKKRIYYTKHMKIHETSTDDVLNSSFTSDIQE